MTFEIFPTKFNLAIVNKRLFTIITLYYMDIHQYTLMKCVLVFPTWMEMG